RPPRPTVAPPGPAGQWGAAVPPRRTAGPRPWGWSVAASGGTGPRERPDMAVGPRVGREEPLRGVGVQVDAVPRLRQHERLQAGLGSVVRALPGHNRRRVGAR